MANTSSLVESVIRSAIRSTARISTASRIVCYNQQRSMSGYKHNLAAEWINPYPSKQQTEMTDPTLSNPNYLPDFAIPRRVSRPNEPLEQKRSRLVWQSRKRGILETDLLLSTYIQQALPTMEDAQLQEYDSLLDENDWDIYYWCTGAKEAPERIKDMSIFDGLVEHCKNKRKLVLRMPNV
ncbi:Succinate dehydrogenase assembly factor 2 mitochondrial [Batrachochytrium dendrobatidis]|nr:Succinate dehydrogenase assembly factor 2 mitochondrial [Batrachochytrium dendrobatidis]KAK5673544.1 Succinate dehydrogenase assembly factor 2 mitochondrial [Batrachochytrium dendrobatidis]